MIIYSGYGIDSICEWNVSMDYGISAMLVLVFLIMMFHTPKKVSYIYRCILCAAILQNSFKNKIKYCSTISDILCLDIKGSESSTSATAKVFSVNMFFTGNLHVSVLRKEV